jgi:hypothetical protein
VSGCIFTANSGAASNLTGYALLPGVLQSYKANISSYSPTVVPEPSTVVLMTIGLGLLGGAAVRRRRAA